MFSTKTLITTALLAATVAAGTPAAQAKGPELGLPGDHFYVYAKMTQKTTWDVPAGAYTEDDCFHHWTGDDHGTDTITVTTKPFRASIMSDEGIVFYGREGQGAPGLPALVKRTRSAVSNRSVGPGPCGGNDNIAVPPLYDCHPLSFDATVALDFSAGKLVPTLGGATSDSADTSWGNCAVAFAHGVDADSLTSAPERFDLDQLKIAPGKRIVAQGGHSWGEHSRLLTTSTTVHWTVRLLRLK